VDVCEHPQRGLAEREEVDVVMRDRRSHRVHDELSEPFAHGSWVAEDLRE
jgi:hypothetical protein